MKKILFSIIMILKILNIILIFIFIYVNILYELNEYFTEKVWSILLMNFIVLIILIGIFNPTKKE